MGLDIARPDQDIPTAPEVFCVESVDLLRIVLAISVESNQDVIVGTLRVGECRLNRSAVTKVAQVGRRHHTKLSQNLSGGIARAIIDNKQVEIGQRRAHSLNNGSNAPGLVI